MLTRDDLDLLAARLFHMLRPHLTYSIPKWLDMNDACQYAGCISNKTMKKLIDEGHIYGKQINGEGSKIIIDRETIDSFLNTGRLN